MKTVRLHGVADLRFEHVAAPGAPLPGWVLVAVEAAGVCGSDLHNYRTGQWISRSPSVAGHEFSGRVAALGAGVQGLALGDAVVADSRIGCGVCPECLGGEPNLCAKLGFVGEVCDGGFAEAVLLPATQLLKLPAGLVPEIAALAEPLAVALHTFRRLAPAPGEPVLVLGCGTIGGLAALAASHLHDGPVLITDRSPARMALVAEVTGARPVALSAEALHDIRLRAAVEATGSVAALEALLGLVSPGAKIALVGIFHGPLNLDANRLVEREVTLTGCHAFADEMPEAVRRAAEWAPQLARLIGACVALEDLPAHYKTLLRGEAPGLKSIVTP